MDQLERIVAANELLGDQGFRVQGRVHGAIRGRERRGQRGIEIHRGASFQRGFRGSPDSELSPRGRRRDGYQRRAAHALSLKLSWRTGNERWLLQGSGSGSRSR
jgi:hypothetical protein